MREYIRQPERQSRTLDSNPHVSKQAPRSDILQAYMDRTLGRPVQRTNAEDDNELLQGKFDSPSDTEQTPVQREVKPNNTGLPDNLKTGIENLSGFSMDDVKVHYNSAKPTQLQALAYAQGSDIHIAPGQEKHLPHEAWHVVQQKQGRVQPTTELHGVKVNNNEGLEKEADVMGGRSVHMIQKKTFDQNCIPLRNPNVIQQRRLTQSEQEQLKKQEERLKQIIDDFDQNKKDISDKLLLVEQNLRKEDIEKVSSIREKSDIIFGEMNFFFKEATVLLRQSSSIDNLRKLIKKLNYYEFSGGKNGMTNILSEVNYIYNRLREEKGGKIESPEERNDIMKITDIDECFFAEYMKRSKPAITVYRGDGRGINEHYLDNYVPQEIVAGGIPDISFRGVVEHTHSNTQKNGMVSTTTSKEQAIEWAVDKNNYGILYEIKLLNYIDVNALLERRKFKSRFAAQKEIVAPGNIPAKNIISLTLYRKGKEVIKKKIL